MNVNRIPKRLLSMTLEHILDGEKDKCEYVYFMTRTISFQLLENGKPDLDVTHIPVNTLALRCREYELEADGTCEYFCPSAKLVIPGCFSRFSLYSDVVRTITEDERNEILLRWAGHSMNLIKKMSDRKNKAIKELQKR